jgi:hypothetical protein
MAYIQTHHLVVILRMLLSGTVLTGVSGPGLALLILVRTRGLTVKMIESSIIKTGSSFSDYDGKIPGESNDRRRENASKLGRSTLNVEL